MKQVKITGAWAVFDDAICGSGNCDSGIRRRAIVSIGGNAREIVAQAVGTLCLLAICQASDAGEIRLRRDEATQWTVCSLSQGDTTIEIVPSAGANVYSWKVKGVEYFHTPPELSKLPGVGYGTPVLYPTPNRVRDASFTFAGERFEFDANNGKNFIHGLVHSSEWTVAQMESDKQSASVTLALDFAPGSKHFEKFPFEHRLQLTIRVFEGRVRWTYFVINTGTKPIPYGFALHPYFKYQGERAETYLTIPAESLMEANDLLPSGKLLDLEGHSLDAREPTSLAGFKADDVYFGMQPERPALVDFRDHATKMTLHASEVFTHIVAYTPNRPFFCIENQTCSTDAHNLDARGMGNVAHLQTCAPGETEKGWVEYRVERVE